MTIDLDDHDDWLRFGRRGPDRGGRTPHFQYSKLRMTKNAKRGAGMRVNVPDGAPKFVFCMGHTQRRGIGADSRTLHRNHLRSQANYHNLDGLLGAAFSFDKDGPVDRVWQRVEPWEDDIRYFRASLNPLNHDQIKDWERFVGDFMDTLQNGSHKTFDSSGKGLHWHADGLLTDEDRAAGNTIDWVASIHRETGRTHAHVLFRGTLGKDDLYIEREAIGQLWIMGRGVASMEHHIGLQMEHNPEMELRFEKSIKRSMEKEQRDLSKRAELDMEID